MKIAIIVWELTLLGGTQRQALELARSLSRAGHEVDVYCYEYDKDRTYGRTRDALCIYSVKNGAARQFKETPALQRSLAWRMTNALRIYASLAKSIFVVGNPFHELKALIEKQHPLSYYDVINVHDYEVYKLARVINHPNIVWMLNDMQRAKDPGGPFFHYLIVKALQRVLIWRELAHIRTIAVMDNRNQKLCKEHYHRDATIVRSGIDLGMFDAAPVTRTWEKDQYALFASSIFFPHRRFEDLVDAIEILVRAGRTNFHLTINGLRERAYDYYLFIRDRIAEKGLGSQITIINGMSESELIAQYQASDIFIFPNDKQTWGLAIFEAMLAGCACVVSRGSGGHEVLTDHENALLVEPRSSGEIARALEYLMANPKEMERISENGVAFVKENLSWDKYAEQMLETFQR